MKYLWELLIGQFDFFLQILPLKVDELVMSEM